MPFRLQLAEQSPVGLFEKPAHSQGADRPLLDKRPIVARITIVLGITVTAFAERPDELALTKWNEVKIHNTVDLGDHVRAKPSAARTVSGDDAQFSEL
jgi:hypothetical protein